jgi:hypothetical protein
MAYASSNLTLKVAQIGRGHSTSVPPFGGNTWAYVSSDALATVNGSSYFSDGYRRGMRKYDTVEHMDTNSTLFSIVQVTAITTSGGATTTTLLTT